MYKNYKHNYPYYEVTPSNNFKEILEEHAAEDVRPAFKFKRDGEVVSVSYREFYDDTRALGSALAKKGFGKAHCACIGPNSYEYLTAFLTMLNGDGVFVPIDKELPIEDVCRIVDDSDAEVLFYADVYEERLKAHLADIPKVKLFIGTEAKEDDDFRVAFSSMLAKGRELIEGGYDAYTSVTPADGDMKMIVYTSGTTGTPKGVMLSLHNLINSVCHGLEVSTVYDVCLSVLPYHHTYEMVPGILVSLKKGATICINENLRTVAANLKLYQPTYIMLVPLFVESFYKKIWANIEEKGKEKTVKNAIALSNKLLKVGIDLRSKLFKDILDVFGGRLKKIVCGGAPLREEVGRFFDAIGITLVQGYGITECSPLVAANCDYYYNFASVGNQLPCLELDIFEPNEEGDGEICVKGDVVMMGYYKQPEKTAEVLTADGWFHTGDYGRIGEDGRLYITGRKKNMIVLKNGKNIFPEEIEDVLSGDKAIAEVIVSGVRDESGVNEIGLAAEVYPEKELVESKSDDELNALIKDVIEAYNDKVPVYKKISKVTVRKEPFDKTTSGKIKRNYNN